MRSGGGVQSDIGVNDSDSFYSENGFTALILARKKKRAAAVERVF